MKRIVAAPTAGSCGVLPAVLLPLARAGEADEEAICEASYVAAGFGQVIAARATLAGARVAVRLRWEPPVPWPPPPSAT